MTDPPAEPDPFGGDAHVPRAASRPVAAGRRRRLPKSVRTTVEWVAIIGGSVLFALVLRTFVVQAFFIPSESMEPLLERNDRVVVNKLTYGFDNIERGDVIVYSRPADSGGPGDIDLIKRVIGLPGDSIVFDDGDVFINGARLNEPYLPAGTFTSPGAGTPQPDDPTVVSRCTPADPCVVPQGYVFTLGDNRPNSKDSRWPDIGYINGDDIVGKAFVRVWPPGRIGGL